MRYLLIGLLLLGCSKPEVVTVTKTVLATTPVVTELFNPDILGKWELINEGGHYSEKGIVFEFTKEDMYLIVKDTRFKNGRYKFIDKNTIEL